MTNGNSPLSKTSILFKEENDMYMDGNLRYDLIDFKYVSSKLDDLYERFKEFDDDAYQKNWNDSDDLEDLLVLYGEIITHRDQIAMGYSIEEYLDKERSEQYLVDLKDMLIDTKHQYCRDLCNFLPKLDLNDSFQRGLRDFLEQTYYTLR